MASLLTLAADREHDLPMSPYLMGALIFAGLCAAMLALLIFGKGRPHS